MFNNYRFRNKRNNFGNKKNIISIIVIIGIIAITIFIALSYIFSGLFSRIASRINREEPEPVIVYREEKTIRVIEGWMNADISNYLKDVFDWTDDEVLNAIGRRRIDNLNDDQDFSRDWVDEFSFLESKPENLSLEGYLFPDTYRVFASTSPEAVVQVMLSNFDKKLSQELRDEIKRQGKTIHEIITMASIIEKEAPLFNQTNVEDARIISGIFWNRLKINMALQSDATLSYIFENKKPAHSGTELTVDSPYNTYRYRGLPPGPIANPGMIAIEAAIYPAETNYMFFLTPLDGSRVHYAVSYEQHLNNKYRYLR